MALGCQNILDLLKSGCGFPTAPPDHGAEGSGEEESSCSDLALLPTLLRD